MASERKHRILARNLFLSTLALVGLAGCGKAPAGAGGSTTIVAAPLAGPNAASLGLTHFNLASISDLSVGFADWLLGTPAFAAVSTFSKFTACNNTLIFLDGSGNQINVNGTSTPSVGQGLLTFSPSATTSMTIGTLNMPAGTTVSEIDITFATVPSVCGGANYAVEFSDGIHGTIDVTQNTAFKFKYPSPTAMNGGTITLMFGQIVNGMVTLGASLNNSTIQTVNAGQAQ